MSTSISSVAAGGILMSPRDVPAWKAALASDRLLFPASRAAMATPFRLKSGRPSFYNMGWTIDALPKEHAFRWHTGSVSGFRCFNFESRATGVAAMLFINAETDRHRAIGVGLVEAFAPGSTPLVLRPIADNDPARTKAARSIITRTEPWNAALFAPELRVVVERFGDEAIDIISEEARPVLAFDLVQVERRAGVFRRRYRITTDLGASHLGVDYTPEGLIYAMKML